MKNITSKLKKEQFLGMMFYVTLLSSLFFYLWWFDRPALPLWGVVVPLYCFWGVMLFLDMRITLSLKDLIKKYEENGIFRVLYTKYKRSVAVFLQLIIEGIFVLILPSLVFPREFGVTLFWDYQTSAIFAGIVGAFHGVAWWNNRKNIKDILENKKYL